MKHKTNYLRFYDTEKDAIDAMRRHNRTIKTLRHRASDLRCVIEGPEDNFAVVDIDTAIMSDLQYRFAS